MARCRLVALFGAQAAQVRTRRRLRDEFLMSDRCQQRLSYLYVPCVFFPAASSKPDLAIKAWPLAGLHLPHRPATCLWQSIIAHTRTGPGQPEPEHCSPTAARSTRKQQTRGDFRSVGSVRDGCWWVCIESAALAGAHPLMCPRRAPSYPGSAEAVWEALKADARASTIVIPPPTRDGGQQPGSIPSSYQMPDNYLP